MTDRRTRLLQALRAMHDAPEASAPGALAFWAQELREVTAWWLLEVDGELRLASPDGRAWQGISLLEVARLLEQEPEG